MVARSQWVFSATFPSAFPGTHFSLAPHTPTTDTHNELTKEPRTKPSMKIQLRRSFALALSALVLKSIAAQPASPGSFSLVGSLSQFRKLHTATLLCNGKVLVAGGAPFAQAATSEIFDPLTATWTNSGPL